MSASTDPFEISGARVLITQNSLYNVAGSEIWTRELALELIRLGADVDVFTYYADAPMLDYFHDIDVHIGDDVSFRAQDYDLVWVHHQIVPWSLLESIKDHPESIPYFVFHHMSSHVDLEMPYLYGFEEKFSAHSTFVSQEAYEELENHYTEKTGVVRSVLPNSVPHEFSEKSRENFSDSPKSVAVVSNHVPEEIRSASDQLRARGVVVDVYGSAEFDTYELITPEILSKYDAVISIGKTVQYCLVGSIPVYVYDMFGGPGYLSNSNYELAREHNFSGRGFTSKKSGEIVNEIITGYSTASSYAVENHEQFCNQYNLEKNLRSVFSGMVLPEPPELSDDYMEYLHTTLSLARTNIVTQIELHRINTALLVDPRELVEIIEHQDKAIIELEEFKSRRVIAFASKIGDKLHALLSRKSSNE